MKIPIILILLLQAGLIASSQVSNDSSSQQVDSAMLYLTGTFKKYDPAKAFNLFMQRANAGEAKAMNAVAMQYTKGLGVDSNFNLAVHWFTQAANHGYTKAWVNLGMLRKRYSSDSSGYAQAVAYFNTAVTQGEPSGYFALGYMYFKGLGCTQSYSNALPLFRQGIVVGRADCMYFTGLCYKFGYGVAANADSASFYIDKAARKGYKQANAELAMNNNGGLAARSSTVKPLVPVTVLKDADEPFEKPAFQKEFLQFDGYYKGVLKEYDYSGKKVIQEIPLTLKVHASGNRITGTWQHGGDESVEIMATQSGNTLTFSPSSFIATTVKAKKRKQQVIFKSAQFTMEQHQDSVYLKGSLQMFNTYTRETGKPMVVHLRQVESREQQDNQIVRIYPNPVEKSFSVSFTLQKQSSVKMSVYNSQGQLVFSKATEVLSQGKHTLQVDRELPTAGIYFLHLSGSNLSQTIAFVKD